MSIKRSGWKEAGQLFSEHGVMIRCVRSDEMGLVRIIDFIDLHLNPIFMFLEYGPSLSERWNGSSSLFSSKTAYLSTLGHGFESSV